MKGIIYGLFCKDDDQLYEFYIGSTPRPYYMRRGEHKHACITPYDPHYNLKVYQYIRAHGGWDNFDFVVLEVFEYGYDINNLLAREDELIVEYGSTLNTIRAKRSRKQYRLDNKDKIHQFNKEYREKNIEKIKEKEKQHREQYKEQIKAQKSEQIKCECNGTWTKGHGFPRHEKTQKHQNYLKSKEANSSHPS